MRDNAGNTHNMMERRAFPPPAEKIIKDCNFCRGNSFAFFARENDFDILTCRRCGLVMVNPLPTFDYLQRFYAQYHEPGSAELWSRYMENIYRYTLEKAVTLPVDAKVLDVGCGYGQFLHMAAGKKYEVFGTELAAEPAEYVEKNFHIPVFRGNIEDSRYENDSFDLITMWFVLEHLIDPLTAVSKVFALLKKGGRLIICVPNIDFRRMLVPFQNFMALDRFLRFIGIKVGTTKFFHAIDPPAHLYGYQRNSLRFLLERVGYGRVWFEVPQNLHHSTMVSRSIENSFNAVARMVKCLTGAKVFLSNGIIGYAEK